ncbi:MAG: hypothetical protein CMP08_01560 [Xanthomonadales bacterium]|nr:hypothetical protein [Xanthomonadales bacterium]|tara:strand:- start:2066 stop:3031 length:966 start_codon:yes stop_codon:yes gene_type:complete
MNEGAAFKSARLAALAGPCRFDDAEALAPLITAIKARHGASVLGVIFYGSCLRSADIRNGLVDFYVIVDHYRRAHDSLLSAAANRLVPPNVYYLETADPAAGESSRLRCKYAVISEAELAYGCRDALTSGLWGRLAQPVAIVYARDTVMYERLRMHCGQAVVTLLEQSLPVLHAPLAPAEVFAQSLALSYGGELRAETDDRSTHITAGYAADYARRARDAIDLLDLAVRIDDQGLMRWRASSTRRRQARRLWSARRPIGRLLSVARLSKACFTFGDAVDYGADKLARHTGVTIEVTPRLRRHPLIYGWPVLWRLYRQGVLK